MKCLDLFCGVGGAAQGLNNSGFDKIIGIDKESQPEYPFEFHKYDIFNMPSNVLNYLINWADLIWSSPPCQLFSFGSVKHINRGKKYPDLIEPTRKLLLSSEKPFIIENVPRAPIRKDLILCGEMFKIRVIRHRHFEIEGFKVPQPKHIKHAGTVKDKYYVSCAGHGGHGSNRLEDWQNAMEIHWTRNKKSIAEAVPPKYSQYIGEWFLKNVKNTKTPKKVST